jgi:hypothetical protein
MHIPGMLPESIPFYMSSAHHYQDSGLLCRERACFGGEDQRLGRSEQVEPTSLGSRMVPTSVFFMCAETYQHAFPFCVIITYLHPVGFVSPSNLCGFILFQSERDFTAQLPLM